MSFHFILKNFFKLIQLWFNNRPAITIRCIIAVKILMVILGYIKVFKRKNKEEVLRLIISKAWEDIDYRKNLITDPLIAIENLTGAKIILPEGITLVVNDQTDKSKVYMNIPSEPDIEDIELTEDQLEFIAGG